MARSLLRPQFLRLEKIAKEFMPSVVFPFGVVFYFFIGFKVGSSCVLCLRRWGDSYDIRVRHPRLCFLTFGTALIRITTCPLSTDSYEQLPMYIHNRLCAYLYSCVS